MRNCLSEGGQKLARSPGDPQKECVKVLKTLVTMVVIVLMVRRLLRRHGDRGRTAGRGGVLRYQVPTGQDPAAVLGTLRAAGVASEPDVVDGESVVVISLTPPHTRDSVRDIVRRAPENMQGDRRPSRVVTFSDES